MPDQQQTPDLDEKDLKKIENHTKYSLWGAGIFIVGVFSAYIINFAGGFSKDGGTWGTFGDYVGGVLNPTIAALALYWLISSIKLQVTELRETNKSLNETVKTAKKQQEQISLQNFENLFFKLLKVKDDALKDIQVGTKENLKLCVSFEKEKADLKIEAMINYKNEGVRGKKSIKDHMIFFKSHVTTLWEEFYSLNMADYAVSYFSICYQISKLIDKSQVLMPLESGEQNCNYSIKQKEYFKILFSTLTQYELEAFFFSGLNFDNDKPRKLIEKYSLFEYLTIDCYNKENFINKLTRYSYRYNKAAFGINDDWENYFLDIESIKKANKQNLEKNINILSKHKVLESVPIDIFICSKRETRKGKVLLFKRPFLINFPRLNEKIKQIKILEELYRRSGQSPKDMADLDEVEMLAEIIIIVRYGISIDEFFDFFDSQP